VQLRVVELLEHLAGPRDVVGDRQLEVVDAGELSLVAEPGHERDLDLASIQLLAELDVERMDLEPGGGRLAVGEGRVGADVRDRGPVLELLVAARIEQGQEARIHAAARPHVAARDVGGREPELPTSRRAVPDLAFDREVAPEQLGRALDPTLADQLADDRRADLLVIVGLDLRNDLDRDPDRRQQLDQGLGSTRPAGAEVKVVADDDLRGREPGDQEALDEGRRIELGDRGIEAEHDQQIDAEIATHPLALGRALQAWRRTLGREHVGRSGFEGHQRHALGQLAGTHEQRLMTEVHAIEGTDHRGRAGRQRVGVSGGVGAGVVEHAHGRGREPTTRLRLVTNLDGGRSAALPRAGEAVTGAAASQALRALARFRGAIGGGEGAVRLAGMLPGVLTLRDLNRATLARQMLLERASIDVVTAIDRLAGLQAQQAKPPFVGLWTRIEAFEREQLSAALDDRLVVRATLMRGTLHLLGAARFRQLRPVLQRALDKGIKMMGTRTKGIDLAAVVEHARELFARGPATSEVLRDHLLVGFPDADERAIAYVVRCTLPLIQVPVAGASWGFPAIAEFALADAWLAGPIDGEEDAAALVRSYLAAFGPASVADAQNWSGVAGLKSTFAALAPELVVFRDERGRELFDLPDAPRPPAKTRAPVRLLPEFDNLVLGHDDRTRVIADEHRKIVVTKNLQVLATFLVDGWVAGTWKVERKKQIATLTFTAFATLTKPVRDALRAEAVRLLGFVEPQAEPVVEFA
jgi:hypothetical protein